ncbi:LANO_0H09054g1_1 [Lachancea nothofagi CBS 11611]|uniref:LANO_0H09054g1_1 n=1 Tax=Lachancea nothofagi CBS 11611 TaxID=1266666 RepID=A0A1G4KLU9_9SACH|nr:LANO_0H09054g1_1 [Lachancea nothofagi CBS 11611]
MGLRESLGKRSHEVTPASEYQRKRFRSPQGDQTSSNRKVILPIFEPSGLLALDSHSKEGIQLQHVEPHDSVSPTAFYVKNSVPLRKQTHFQAIVYDDSDEAYAAKFDLLDRSNYLVGRKLTFDDKLEEENDDSREIVLAQIPIPEETCSKQHCVIQFRNREGRLKPYVIDLDSSNGTLLNGVALPRARYVELKNEDVLRFSTNESESGHFLMFLSA